MGEFLASFIEKQTFIQNKLTKLTELYEKLGIVSFVSADEPRRLRDYGEANADIYHYEELSGMGHIVGSDFTPFPAWCLICGAISSLSETLTLVKLKCSGGCPSTFYQVKIVEGATVRGLFELLTLAQLEDVTEAVEERMAIITADGIEPEDAIRTIQQSILPPLLDALELR